MKTRLESVTFVEYVMIDAIMEYVVYTSVKLQTIIPVILDENNILNIVVNFRYLQKNILTLLKYAI